MEAIASGTPPNRVEQGVVKEMVRGLVVEETPEHEHVVSVFDSAGVKERGFARDLDWYLSGPGWPERATAFEEASVALSKDVIEGALGKVGVGVEDVDGIVVVNTTGVATPSLDALIVNRLGFRGDTLRVPLWGYGCAGGVAGLARACELARAHPGKRFLLVCVELCSLAFVQEDLSKKTIVASALFGDGAAAALVAGEDVRGKGPVLDAFGSRLWRDTEEVMGWEVLEEGLGVVFSERIPEVVRSRLGSFMGRFLEKQGVRMGEVEWVLHPGGPRVLEAYGDALGVDQEDLEASWGVLGTHGNMSSPSVLFVLENVLDQGGEGPLVLGAVGPGFAGELGLVVPG